VVRGENLRRLAERSAWRHLARRAAQGLFEALPHLEAGAVRAQLQQWQAAWPADPAMAALALRLHERLADRRMGQPEQRDPDDSPWAAAAAWLAEVLPDPTAAQAAEQAESAADHQSIRNAIGSLRNLGAADWAGLFQAVHPTLRALGCIDVYRQEHEATRDMAMHGIEALTERHGAAESDVAEVLQRLCNDPAWQALTLRELWALPSTLRVVLVENLRRLAERSAWRHLARRAAQRLFEALPELHAAAVRTQLRQWQALWPETPAVQALALRLHERMADRALGQPEHTDPADSAWAAAADWLTHTLPDPAAAQAAEQAESAADHQSIRNAIGSLRNLGAAAWAGLFESVHPTLRALARIDVYRQEDEATRDRVMHAIEALTERHGAAEADVAEVLQRLCNDPAWPDDAEETAPLYWLCGPGWVRLLAALGLRPTGGERLRAAWRRHRTALYLGGLAVLLAVTEVGLLVLGLPPQAHWPLVVAAVLLSLLPASEAVVALANRLISESVPPSRLPRLSWPQGIPASARTLVVMPCMLTRPKGIATLLAQLERHHLANLESQAQFALLSDWGDAKAEHMPNDDALLAKARAGIEALNQRHGSACGDRPRFLLLHRRRRWSETEQRWIGWERTSTSSWVSAARTCTAARTSSGGPDIGSDSGSDSGPDSVTVQCRSDGARIAPIDNRRSTHRS